MSTIEFPELNLCLSINKWKSILCKEHTEYNAFSKKNCKALAFSDIYIGSERTESTSTSPYVLLLLYALMQAAYQVCLVKGAVTSALVYGQNGMPNVAFFLPIFLYFPITSLNTLLKNSEKGQLGVQGALLHWSVVVLVNIDNYWNRRFQMQNHQNQCQRLWKIPEYSHELISPVGHRLKPSLHLSIAVELFS